MYVVYVYVLSTQYVLIPIRDHQHFTGAVVRIVPVLTLMHNCIHIYLRRPCEDRANIPTGSSCFNT